jgi:hypothetical protein
MPDLRGFLGLLKKLRAGWSSWVEESTLAWDEAFPYDELVCIFKEVRNRNLLLTEVQHTTAFLHGLS